MHRKHILGLRRPIHSSNSVLVENLPILSGLDPYDGSWTDMEAGHLLRRAIFGPTIAQIREGTEMGLDACLNQLFDDSTIPLSGPINPGKIPINDSVEDIDDPYVAAGNPWVWKQNGRWEMALFPTDIERFVIVQTYRNFSLRGWKTESIFKEGISIREKMTLFWHNHFAVAGENAGFEFLHNITLMENALGNFRELVKMVTLDPAMLQFLNGGQNTRLAPNENYARELFELFTIGKGDLAGPGDYTNYTEADILAAARVLTGWSIKFENLQHSNDSKIRLDHESLLRFSSVAHDPDPKQFSARFGHRVIDNLESEEYAQLINMIFLQDECARFICRKLYRWFVYYQISDEIESAVIQPMAQILINNDYNIEPALKALLSSKHFFDMLNVGPMIKNPYDFIMSIIKPIGLEQQDPEDPLGKFLYYLGMTNMISILQMNYFAPPNVAGWKAYYQEPLFYRTWINATTLNYRMAITNNLTVSKEADGGPTGFSLDVLSLVEKIENPEDPNVLIETLTTHFFPQPITESQRNYLKGILIPGLPDFEWTVEYSNYLFEPENLEIKKSVDQKLRSLIRAMLSMPEFYLS